MGDLAGGVPRAVLSHFAFAAALRARLARASGGLIGIDGAGASGKSTIARGLARADADIQVIALDDFYRPTAARHAGPVAARPIAADFDLERLRSEVLEPLMSHRPAAHRVYDWRTDAVGSELVVVRKPIVILEGVYATSLALAPYLDVSIWVDCPRAVRLARGLARDGEVARPRWQHDWMPGEDKYMETEHPQARATFVCDGAREDLSEGVVVRES
jgi:uridine kinase